MAASYYQSPVEPVRQTAATGPIVGGKPLRRSQRVTLRMPLLVFAGRGQGHANDFQESTHVLRVSAHGGLLELEQGLQRGDKFMLRHDNRNDETECRVVSISKSQAGKRLVGFEFTNAKVDFWRMSFPPPGARPILEKHK